MNNKAPRGRFRQSKVVTLERLCQAIESREQRTFRAMKPQLVRARSPGVVEEASEHCSLSTSSPFTTCEMDNSGDGPNKRPRTERLFRPDSLGRNELVNALKLVS